MNDVKFLTERIKYLTKLSRNASIDKNWNLHNEYEEQIQRLKLWRKQLANKRLHACMIKNLQETRQALQRYSNSLSNLRESLIKIKTATEWISKE